MDWNKLIYSAVETLLPVLVIALIALLTFVTNYFRAKAEGIKNEVARKSFLSALNEAEQVAIDAVKATNQVLVDSLKKAREDGKLTDEEAKAAMNEAKKYFLSHMSSNSLNILTAAIGPVEKWLEGLLEAKISEQKYGKVYTLANQ